MALVRRKGVDAWPTVRSSPNKSVFRRPTQRPVTLHGTSSPGGQRRFPAVRRRASPKSSLCPPPQEPCSSSTLGSTSRAPGLAETSPWPSPRRYSSSYQSRREDETGRPQRAQTQCPDVGRLARGDRTAPTRDDVASIAPTTRRRRASEPPTLRPTTVTRLFSRSSISYRGRARMSHTMTPDEVRAFLSHSTRTAKAPLRSEWVSPNAGSESRHQRGERCLRWH